MNTTGCPTGWATDEVLFYLSTPGSCDMSIAAWGVLTIGLVTARVITAIGQTHLWMVRRRRFLQQDTKAASRARKALPIVPFLTWTSAIGFVALYLLSTLDIVNTRNGWSAFLYGVTWFQYSTLALLYLLKFVRLGNRILPLNARSADGESRGLSRFDAKGQASFGFSCVALFGQTVVLCILGPLFPRSNWIIQVASAFHAWFTFQQGMSLVNHFERIKKASKQVSALHEQSRFELRPVIRKLVEQQVIALLTSWVGSILLLFVAVGLLQVRYFVLTIISMLDTGTMFLFMLSNYKSRRHEKKKTHHTTTPVSGSGVDVNPQATAMHNRVVVSLDSLGSDGKVGQLRSSSSEAT